MENCLNNQIKLKNIFAACDTQESRYQKIIQLGLDLPQFDIKYKTQKNIVDGCQSVMYLHSELKQNLLYFQVDSNALISKGLGAILVLIYNGESPQTILQCNPTVLEQINIYGSLSSGRTNGLNHLYIKIKQASIEALASQSTIDHYFL